jgi:hypothetical protein
LERRAHALSLGAWRRRPELVHRVQSILRCKRALHPLAAHALVGVVACGLLLGSVELAHCPQVVAFVPAQREAAPQRAAEARTGAAAARGADVADAPAGNLSLERGANGFHAIETKAIAHGRRSAARPLVAALRRRASEQLAGATEGEIAAINVDARDANAGAPQQVLLKAEMPASAAPAQERQYIVFTAWEVVRIFPQKTREAADYDTGAAAQHQAGESRPGTETTTKITVTRLILRIYPANAAPGAKPTPATGSNSGRPIALPFDGSWLVLEL